MKKVLGIVAVVVLLLIGGYFISNNKQASSTSLSTMQGEVQGVPGVSQIQNTQAHFVSSKAELESTEQGWIKNGLELVIAPTSGTIDFTGWSLHSTVSGKRYTFGQVTPLGSTSKVGIALDASQEGALFIHTARAHDDYLAEGNEYHVFLGSQFGWDKESDTVELVSPTGVVVDTYSY